MDDVYSLSDVLIIGSQDPDFEYLANLDTDKVVIDLVRITDDLSDTGPNYQGICW